MRRLGSWLLAACGAVALLAVVTLPLPAREQAMFAVGSIAGCLLLALLPGRAVSLVLVAFSAAVSLRYLCWRLTDTLDFPTWPEWVLGTGLMAAELYATLMLLLAYLQTAWPLRRPPLPLPADPDRWPSVDVFIPTLDEPLAVVRTTVLAALAMDWPADALRVWLLDDSDRPTLRTFAQAAGCRYLARAEHRHAKAGNLNHALAHSESELVAVFDCDHVPTRAFLQLTVGWLVAEPTMAFVQTPQLSRTPDLFQRLAGADSRSPAEEALFHRRIQDGSDTWNAAMFSGSCAVLRRAALDDVGGFATETLTEDAHTSLRLHRRGWDSAFVGIPLAAGLAVNSLADHLRQRRRWTRGMLAMLRRDFPLTGSGLSFGQRLCYLHTAGHFLFAWPRVAFLSAPLVFLLLGQSVIAASPLAVIAYALPHLVQGVVTSARLQGRFRRVLSGQVYETVLALPLLGVTLAALARPRAGRFVVTPKGAAPTRRAYDLRAAWPNVVLAALLVSGLIAGGVRLALAAPSASVAQALGLNAAWAVLALVAVGVALAVGRERSGGARITASLPVTVLPGDGRSLAGVTRSLGPDVCTLALDPPEDLAGAVQVGFRIGGEAVALVGQVLGQEAGLLQVAWSAATLEQQARLARVVFGRADAWTDAAPAPVGATGGWFGRRRAGAARAMTVLVAAVLATSLLLAPSMAAAQSPGPSGSDMTVRPIPGAPGEPAPGPTAAAQATPTPAAPMPASPPVPVGSRTVVYTLQQLGAAGPLALRGTVPVLGVGFGVRADEVVTAATLSVSGAVSPALIPDLSRVTVTLNGQYLASIPADRRTPGFTLDVPVAPSLFQESNRLQFHFAGSYATGCEDPLSALLWATIADSSTLTLTLARLPPQRDLSRLPRPFFDPHDPDALSLPFVLPPSPGNDALRAAGIAASWFGTLAGSRGARFPVQADLPASGDAVMVIAGADDRLLPGEPPIDGPTLAVLPNPRDALGSVLVVAGRTGEEAVTAATTLALGIRVLGGATATVQAPEVAARQPYDAPAWLPTDRPVRLGELVDAAALQGTGYTGLLDVPFRTVPDFYTWKGRPFALHLRWRAPSGPVIDLEPSRLDVGLNGLYLASLSLAAQQARLGMPRAAVAGANELQLYFDAQPLRRERCGPVGADLRMAIDPESTIDLSRGYRIARLPSLGLFASSGFPFTRMADLSQTAIVLPDRPDAAEIGAYLELMGRLGAQTGLPGSGVAVVRPGEADSVAERDLLLVGTIAHMQAADPLLEGSPVRLSGDRLQVTLGPAPDAWQRTLHGPTGPDRARAAVTLSAGVSAQTALLAGGPSPLRAGRSVVVLLAGSGAALDDSLRLLRDPARAAQVRGDLAMLSGGQVTSYRVGPRYTVGSLPFWLWPSWYLSADPLGALALLAAGCIALGLALFWGLRRRASGRLPARTRAD